MDPQEDSTEPFEGDVVVQSQFTLGSGKTTDAFKSMPLSSSFSSSSLQSSVKMNTAHKGLLPDSVPRKPLPVSEMTEAFTDIAMMADSLTEKDEQPLQALAVKRDWRFYGVFAALGLINFICAIDATILSVALPLIATDIKGTTAIQAFWIGTSYMLCATVFQPSWASFSHVLGRLPVLLAALFFFTVGTIICSVGHTVSILLLGRCIQGVGGGGLTALTLVVISDMVTLRERGKWISVISLNWAVGTVIGPVIGGAFAENTTYRWMFWFNLPFCGIAAVALPICLRLHRREGSAWEKLKQFDWLGSFLFVSSATSFLIPITWGGVMYSWSSWRTLVPLFLGLAGIIGFILYSAYFSRLPLIKRSLFSTPTAITAYIGTTAQGLILWSMLYYLPLYFEVAKDYSAIKAGIALFPATFTVSPAALFTGLLITKTGRYRPSLWVGWFLATLGMGILIYLNVSTTVPSWIFLSLISGAGLGTLVSAQSFACQAPVTSADIPFAAAIYSFFRAAGQTLGVAIAGVIFQNSFKKKLLATAYKSNADTWSRDASSLVLIVKSWSAAGEEGVMKQVVIQAYVESLKIVWVVMTALAGAAFIATLLFTAEVSLEREIETEQGFRYDVVKKSQSQSRSGKVPLGDVETSNMGNSIDNTHMDADATAGE